MFRFFSFLQQHDIFHMMRMREHVNGLYGSHFVFTVQQLQVACLVAGLQLT